MQFVSHDYNPRIILLLGVVMVTTSSFIVRYALQDPYTLAAARVLITGTLSLIISTQFRYTRLELQSKEILLIFVAGISLASHFAWWFASLSYIPVGTSLSLTNTAPVWIAIISLIVFKQLPNRRGILSIMFVLIGTSILFMGSNTSDLEIYGLILALSSAIGFAIYLIIAKMMVKKVGLWRYFGLVNSISGLTLLPIVLLQEKSILLPNLWFFGLLLAIFPGLLGHAVYNWAMAKLDQVEVAIATLGEPILGTIIAAIIFTELLGSLEIIGMAFLLGAILLSMLNTNSEKKNEAENIPRCSKSI